MFMARSASDWTLADLDRMVRPASPTLPLTWAEMPTPSLVAEILSGTTRRRDNEQKRDFYRRIGVADYWMVDHWTRSVRAVRYGTEDVVVETALQWRANGARDAFRLDVAQYFAEALGEA